MAAPPLRHSFEMRVAMLVERLQHVRSCSSAQQAHDVVAQAWCQVHRDCQASPRYLAVLQQRRLCVEQGWRNLGQSVCYFDSEESPRVRLYLHRDGGIVIQRMQADNVEILFTLPGRLQPATLAPGA